MEKDAPITVESLDQNRMTIMQLLYQNHILLVLIDPFLKHGVNASGLLHSRICLENHASKAMKRRQFYCIDAGCLLISSVLNKKKNIVLLLSVVLCSRWNEPPTIHRHTLATPTTSFSSISLVLLVNRTGFATGKDAPSKDLVRFLDTNATGQTFHPPVQIRSRYAL
jgi:hypothetical protein